MAASALFMGKSFFRPCVRNDLYHWLPLTHQIWIIGEVNNVKDEHGQLEGVSNALNEEA